MTAATQGGEEKAPTTKGEPVAGEGKCENSDGQSGTQRTRALQVELIAVDYIWEGVIKGCEDF